MPQSVTLETDEIRRINRAQVALLLGKTPRAIDNEPAQDVYDVLAVHQHNEFVKAGKKV